MAIFKHHEACPKCGSKDNLGRYDDNSAYCFGCKHTEFGNRFIPKIEETTEKKLSLPHDATSQINKVAVDWLNQYEITPEERIRYRMLWSESKQQLIFPMFDGESNLLAWQAKNFATPIKSKYYSQGKIHDLLYFCGKKLSPIILVEDLVSAIKIGRIASAMPLFGSEASTQLLMRLKTHCNSVILWLDSDKWKNSHDIVNRAKSIGLPAMSVFTNLDPKEYTVEKIKYFLTN